MTDSLSIDRFRARYRLPPSRAEVRGRLDLLLGRMLSDPVSEPIDVGLRAQEICIRAVEAPFRVRLDATDEAIVGEWRSVVIDAVVETARSHGPVVVRFPSRRHALVDLVLGVATGDLDRAWAWRQLGLWSVGETTASDAAVDAAVAALSAEPEAIVPVLAEVAARGAFDSLLVELGERRLAALAVAAWARGGASKREHPGSDVAPDARMAEVEAVARRIVTSSRIAMAAARAMPSVLLPESRRAIALLALLEVEPARAAQSSNASPLVDAIVAALRPELEPTVPRSSSRNRRTDSRSVLRTADAADRVADDSVERSATRDETSTALDRPEIESELDGAPSLETPTAAEPAVVHETDEARLSARTEFAGLLFLVNVLVDLDLVAHLVADDVFGDRSSRWRLHRLALALAPVAPDDPAALAFAGLASDDAPPDGGEPTPAETTVLTSAAEAVAERVRTLLNREHEPAADVVAGVVLRRGQVLADAGWIEVELSIDDVDTDVRRAALDRDPGWVPWLGVVLRFVYV